MKSRIELVESIKEVEKALDRAKSNFDSHKRKYNSLVYKYGEESVEAIKEKRVLKGMETKFRNAEKELAELKAEAEVIKESYTERESEVIVVNKEEELEVIENIVKECVFSKQYKDWISLKHLYRESLSIFRTEVLDSICIYIETLYKVLISTYKVSLEGLGISKEQVERSMLLNISEGGIYNSIIESILYNMLHSLELSVTVSYFWSNYDLCERYHTDKAIYIKSLDSELVAYRYIIKEYCNYWYGDYATKLIELMCEFEVKEESTEEVEESAEVLEVKEEEKKESMVMSKEVLVSLLEAMGGSLWERYGKCRVYFNSDKLESIVDLTYTEYKGRGYFDNDNFYLKGQKVSNNKGRGYLSELQYNKCFYDFADNSFHFDGVFKGEVLEALNAELQHLMLTNGEIKASELEGLEEALVEEVKSQLQERASESDYESIMAIYNENHNTNLGSGFLEAYAKSLRGYTYNFFLECTVGTMKEEAERAMLLGLGEYAYIEKFMGEAIQGIIQYGTFKLTTREVVLSGYNEGILKVESHVGEHYQYIPGVTVPLYSRESLYKLLQEEEEQEATEETAEETAEETTEEATEEETEEIKYYIYSKAKEGQECKSGDLDTYDLFEDSVYYEALINALIYLDSELVKLGLSSVEVENFTKSYIDCFWLLESERQRRHPIVLECEFVKVTPELESVYEWFKREKVKSKVALEFIESMVSFKLGRENIW